MSQHLFLRAIFSVLFLFCMMEGALASSRDTDQITQTLTDYMEGTANGDPERLKNAFHPDFKLYAVTEANELLVRSGKQYIADIKPGEKINRVGSIMSIDLTKDIATAKVEILMPNFRLYTDYFMLVKYQDKWKIVQKSYTWKEVSKSNNEILFVTSNQHTYGSSNINAANHFQEIVIAYDVFKKNGYDVDFVSPSGGAIPLGYIETSDKTQKEYLYNPEFMTRLKHTLKPEQLNAADYKAVYYSGGGSAMFGVAENKNIQNLAVTIYQNGGVISAICHGTAGIVNLKNKDGAFIFANKKITGFPDMFEDTQAEYYKTFPFSIDKEITKNGGNFVYSKAWASNFTVADGNIITGQDPSATASVAQKVIDTLQEKSK
jgi:putative intracellular protease/amidase